MSREAMQMALEALESDPATHVGLISRKQAIAALRERLAQPEQEPVAWMQIDTAPKGRIVLVHYKNSLGNGRTMRARYYLPETLDSDSTESGWADEGWYEESEAYEYLIPLEYEPTHWMALPAAPDTQLTHTTPPKREWVGLTDEEIQDLSYLSQKIDEGNAPWFDRCGFARAIEAKLKEKNV